MLKKLITFYNLVKNILVKNNGSNNLINIHLFVNKRDLANN